MKGTKGIVGLISRLSGLPKAFKAQHELPQQALYQDQSRRFEMHIERTYTQTENFL